MTKYIVALSYGKKNHAGSKAPTDVVNFLAANGWNRLNLSVVNTLKYLIQPFDYLSIRRRISAGDEILFQLPCYSGSTSKWMFRIADYARRKGAVTTALLHDVDFLRNFGKLSREEELSRLEHFDRLVLHSEAMREALDAGGCKLPSSILGLFDYGVRVPADSSKTADRKAVVFAGNLSKSAFVPYLDELSGNTLAFNLYGAGAENIPLSGRVRYMGKFKSDDLSSIEGGWGLVWDGDSLDACKGDMGEYLKYNSPHKASLYLCCGLPLIVPEGSAVSEIVRKEGLGIVLKSLRDINSAVSGVSDAEYAGMKSRAAAYGARLSEGSNLLSALGK